MHAQLTLDLQFILDFVPRIYLYTAIADHATLACLERGKPPPSRCCVAPCAAGIRPPDSHGEPGAWRRSSARPCWCDRLIHHAICKILPSLSFPRPAAACNAVFLCVKLLHAMICPLCPPLHRPGPQTHSFGSSPLVVRPISQPRPGLGDPCVPVPS